MIDQETQTRRWITTLSEESSGNRNNQLNITAWLLGRSGIEYDEAYGACYEACTENGLATEDFSGFQRTFESGYTAGVYRGPLGYSSTHHVTDAAFNRMLTVAGWLHKEHRRDFDIWINHEENHKTYSPTYEIDISTHSILGDEDNPLYVTNRKAFQRALIYVNNFNSEHILRMYSKMISVLNRDLPRIRRADQRRNYIRYISAVYARMAIEGRNTIIMANDSAKCFVDLYESAAQQAGNPLYTWVLEPIHQLQMDIPNPFSTGVISSLLTEFVETDIDVYVKRGVRGDRSRATVFQLAENTSVIDVDALIVQGWYDAYHNVYEALRDDEDRRAAQNHAVIRELNTKYYEDFNRPLKTLDDGTKVLDLPQHAVRHEFNQMMNGSCPLICPVCYTTADVAVLFEDFLNGRLRL